MDIRLYTYVIGWINPADILHFTQNRRLVVMSNMCQIVPRGLNTRGRNNKGETAIGDKEEIRAKGFLTTLIHDLKPTIANEIEWK